MLLPSKGQFIGINETWRTVVDCKKAPEHEDLVIPNPFYYLKAESILILRSVKTGGIILLKSAGVTPAKVRIESEYNQVRDM